MQRDHAHPTYPLPDRTRRPGTRPHPIASRLRVALLVRLLPLAYDVGPRATSRLGDAQARCARLFYQKQAKDAHEPGAGHLQRYVTGERQPIIAEDTDGTGFACDEDYEVHNCTSATTAQR